MQLMTKCCLSILKNYDCHLELFLHYRTLIWAMHARRCSVLEDTNFHIYRMKKPPTLSNASTYLLNFLSEYETFLLQEKHIQQHLKHMCLGYLFNSLLSEYNINWKLLHETFIQHNEHLPARTPTTQIIPGCHYACCQLFICYTIYAIKSHFLPLKLVEIKLKHKEKKRYIPESLSTLWTVWNF